MVQATIYYVDMPHPSESKFAEKYWSVLHYDKDIKIVYVSKAQFKKYWQKMPYKENIKSYKDLDQLWHKYNIYRTNPCSSDNDPGQVTLKKLGVRHTSMSIGDVVKIGTIYYIAVSYGWAKLKIN